MAGICVDRAVFLFSTAAPRSYLGNTVYGGTSVCSQGLLFLVPKASLPVVTQGKSYTVEVTVQQGNYDPGWPVPHRSPTVKPTQFFFVIHKL